MSYSVPLLFALSSVGSILKRRHGNRPSLRYMTLLTTVRSLSLSLSLCLFPTPGPGPFLSPPWSTSYLQTFICLFRYSIYPVISPGRPRCFRLAISQPIRTHTHRTRATKGYTQHIWIGSEPDFKHENVLRHQRSRQTSTRTLSCSAFAEAEEERSGHSSSFVQPPAAGPSRLNGTDQL